MIICVLYRGSIIQDRGAGQNSVVIRGIASSPQTEDSSAGVYFGETPISDLGSSSGLGNAGNADIKLVDIERVEVLRGPQGTLYGSGSMGGTVRVIPTGPNLEQLEGKLATRYSQTGGDGGDNTMLQGALNVPVIEDKLAVRGVLYRFDNSGYITNVAESQPSSSITNAVSMGSKAEDRDDVGNETYKGVRLTALWKPTDNFDVTLGYIQQEIEQDGTPEINLDLEGDYQQRRVNTGPEGVSYESLENDIDISSLTLNYDFGWSSITSSSSWVDYESAVETDFSHIFGPYYSDSTKVFDFFIQEVRLISQLDGRLQFVAGLYYEDKENEFKFLIPWSGDPALDTGPLQNVDTDRTIEQQAFFGELSYDLSDKLVATVGGRYFDYERTRVDTADVAGIRRFTNRETGTEETGQTYKANLTYNPNDDMLVYAQWAEGFRLGKGQAENIRCTDLGIETPSSVDSDTSENFEIGFKSSLVDNSVMFNAAIYRINWDDIPIKVQPEGRCSYDDNAGTAKSEGIEIELLARLTESFQLDLSASYGEATLTEDAPAVGGSKGDDLPGSADYNVNLGLEYNFILAGYDSFSRIDYAYLGEYHNSFNSEGQAAGGFGQINFKVGVEIDKVALDLFVNNLADDDGLTWVESTNFNLSGVSRAYRIRPRTVGLNLSYSF